MKGISRRYPSRRSWRRTVIVGWSAVILLLVGIMVFAMTGKTWPVLWVVVIAVAGVFVSAVREARGAASYLVEEDLITLTRNGHRMEIPITTIADASLIDREAARGYFQSRAEARGLHDRSELRAAMHDFVRYCTVEIGRNLMIATSTDMEHSARLEHDLVLLRLRNGTELLLSPENGRSLVEMLGRKSAMAKAG
jgi:hypothetical protein